MGGLLIKSLSIPVVFRVLSGHWLPLLDPPLRALSPRTWAPFTVGEAVGFVRPCGDLSGAGMDVFA